LSKKQNKSQNTRLFKYECEMHFDLLKFFLQSTVH